MKTKFLFGFLLMLVCVNTFSQGNELTNDTAFQRLKKIDSVLCIGKYGKEKTKMYKTIALGNDVYREDSLYDKLIYPLNCTVYLKIDLMDTRILVLDSSMHFYYELQNEGGFELSIGKYSLNGDTMILNSSIVDYYKLYYKPKSIKQIEFIDDYIPFPMLNERFLKRKDEIINLISIDE